MVGEEGILLIEYANREREIISVDLQRSCL